MTPEELQSFWSNAASNTMGYDPTAFNTQYNVDANIGGFPSFDVDSNIGGFPSYNVNTGVIPGAGNIVDPTGGFKTDYNVNPEGGFKTDYQVNTGGGFKTDYNVDATGGFKTDYDVSADTSIWNQNQKVNPEANPWGTPNYKVNPEEQIPGINNQVVPSQSAFQPIQMAETKESYSPFRTDYQVNPDENFASTISATQGGSESSGTGDYTGFGGGLLFEAMNRGNAVFGNPDDLNFDNLQPWQQKVLQEDSGTLVPSIEGNDMLDAEGVIAQNQQIADKTNPQSTTTDDEEEEQSKLSKGLKALGSGFSDMASNFTDNRYQYGNIF